MVLRDHYYFQSSYLRYRAPLQHTASFVSRHADEIEALFEQVLVVCHEQGLLGNELFAIDGCKMSSDVSKEWSGTFKDKKNPIIIGAQAFGEGQKHHTLKPVLEKVEARFKQLGIAENIYQKGTIVTADIGFANPM